MNRRDSHVATCHRKKRFVKEGQAFQHLLDRIRAGTVDPGMTTYRCVKCRGWHIGGHGSRSLERVIREGAA